MIRSVIVSGPPAVGKTTVARALAAEFGLEYVSGGDVLKGMAAEHGYDPSGDDWWDTEEGMRFLAQRAGDASFDRRLDERLSAMFAAGGVAMTSYTLPWLVRGGAKIWLAGSHESIARRMQGRDDMGAAEAADMSRRRYAENRDLYRRIYGFDFGADTGVFDAVIDTDGLGAGEVIAAATAAVRGLL